MGWDGIGMDWMDEMGWDRMGWIGWVGWSGVVGWGGVERDGDGMRWAGTEPGWRVGMDAPFRHNRRIHVLARLESFLTEHTADEAAVHVETPPGKANNVVERSGSS